MQILSVHLALLPIFLFSLTLASPLSPRDVASHGPEGILTPEQRWRDTVGTALQIHGPTPKYKVTSTLRSGPLSSVFRSSLSSNEIEGCEPRADTKCEIAINGFGTVGEVHYNFTSNDRQLKGRSTQVMVACRCLSKECGVAILLRPVNVISRETETPIRRTCMYEVFRGRYSDCHAELLRVSYRPVNQLPEISHSRDYFRYHPKWDEKVWYAEGQRGWTHDCYEDQVASLRRVNIGSITEKNIKFNKHTTAAKNSCSPPEGIEYVVEENDADGEECAKLYHYAASGGAHRGTQQDEIATGASEESYLAEKPDLISDTELALVCSAAGLGAMFVWTMYWKQMKKDKDNLKRLGAVILAQILSYTLEALPLHIALGNEIRAAAWRCLLAFMDGTLAVARETLEVQGSVNGSILVLTGVVGEVRYSQTREWLVWVLTVMFDLMVAVVITITALGKGRQIVRENKEEIYVKGKITGYKRKRRTRRRISWRMGREEDDSDSSNEKWYTSPITSSSGANSAVLGTTATPTFRTTGWDNMHVPQKGSMGQTEEAVHTTSSPTSSPMSGRQMAVTSLQ